MARKQNITALVDAALLKRIDDYRAQVSRRMGIPFSRSNILCTIIRTGLNALEAPEAVMALANPDLEKDSS